MQKIVFFLLLGLIINSKDPELIEHVLPIYGNASLGYYYVKLYIGTPPQEQSVIIDTGSGQLALPCNRCTNCNPNHVDKPFDMRKSKTSKYVTCVILFSILSNLVIHNVKGATLQIQHNNAGL